MLKLCSVALGVSLAWAGAAMAQDYPAKPIRLIAPFAPDGSTDVPAKTIAG